MKNEIPETTERHFHNGTLAVAANVQHFCDIALEAGNKQAVINLGRVILQIVNNTMQCFEAEKNATIN